MHFSKKSLLFMGDWFIYPNVKGILRKKVLSEAED